MRSLVYLINTLHKKCPYLEFLGPYFPTFGLKTERYEVSFRILSECGKIQTRKTQNTDTFHEVIPFHWRFRSRFIFAFALTCLTHKKVIHSSNGDQLEDVEVKYILLFSSFEVMPQMLKRRTYFSTYSKSSLQFILILPHSTVPLVFLPKTRIQWNKAKSWLKYMNKSRIDS